MKIVETNVDAYNYLLDACEDGYRQDIARGSFEKTDTYRMQAHPVMIEIFDPLNFLYLPKEVTVGMIEKYYDDYLLDPSVSKNETYTYGNRISTQLPSIIEMLSGTPETNQASISISQPDDIYLRDPPCLRELSFSCLPVTPRGEFVLNVTSFWRSNDIGAAFLMNQGGVALLLRDVASCAGLAVGSHYYVSPGAHVYRYGGDQ